MNIKIRIKKRKQSRVRQDLCIIIVKIWNRIIIVRINLDTIRQTIFVIEQMIQYEKKQPRV